MNDICQYCKTPTGCSDYGQCLDQVYREDFDLRTGHLCDHELGWIAQFEQIGREIQSSSMPLLPDANTDIKDLWFHLRALQRIILARGAARAHAYHRPVEHNADKDSGGFDCGIEMGNFRVPGSAGYLGE